MHGRYHTPPNLSRQMDELKKSVITAVVAKGLLLLLVGFYFFIQSCCLPTTTCYYCVECVNVEELKNQGWVRVRISF